MAQGLGFRWSIASFRCTMAKSRYSQPLDGGRRFGFCSHAPMTSKIRTAWALFIAIMLAAGGAACAKARAETIVADGPPLQVPEPPSRVPGPVEALVTAPRAREPGPPPAAVVPRTPPRPAPRGKPRPPQPRH